MPPRFRESAASSSPTLRPSTPSSGINPSPAPSPLSSSPHPSQGNTSTHQSPSGICTNTGQTNFVVDRNADVLRFKPATIAPQQYLHSYPHPQAVPTVLHVYPDSGSSLQMNQQHIFSNFNRPPARSLLATSASQVVLRPALLQNIQASSSERTAISIAQPVNTIANLQDGQTAVFSPVKVNSPQTITVPMTLLSPEDSRHSVHFQQRFLSDATTASDHYTSLGNSNVRMIQKTLAFNTHPAPSLFVSQTSPVVIQSDKGGIANVVISNDSKISLNQSKQDQIRIPDQNVVVSTASSDLLSIRAVPSNAVPLRPTKPTSLSNTSVKKRQNPTPSTNSKKRKTALSPVSAVNNKSATACGALDSSKQPSVNKATPEIVQQLLDKLKHQEPKDLVSDPRISSFAFVLPPYGAASHPVFLCSPQEEDLRLREKGLKYRRTPFSSSVQRSFALGGDEEVSDSFMLQHMEANTPIEPMLHTTKHLKFSPSSQRPQVCPSPKPVSLESSLMALYTGTSQLKSGFDDSESDPATTLLPVFHIANNISRDFPQDRCTPPLPVYHMPNPHLLIRSPGINGKGIESNKKDCLSAELSCAKETSPYTDDSSLPVVDSETGEVLGGRRPKEAREVTGEDEQLHVTFTINSSMTDSVPEVIRRITDLLGIDSGSLTYEVTRSGTQITFGQNQSQSKNVIRDLESHLRQHFTPLSMHLTKSINECKSNSSLTCSGCAPVIAPRDTVDSAISSDPKFSSRPLEPNFNSGQPSSLKYSEDPVSISKLLALKRDATELCKYCEVPVPPGSAVLKRVDELASAAGLSIRSDFTCTETSELIFCGESCVSKFSAAVADHRLRIDSTGEKPQVAFSHMQHQGTFSQHLSGCHEPRQQLIVSELVPTVPILLQNAPLKPLKANISNKRNALQINCNSTALKRRLGTPGSISPKSKRWKGVRWRSFASDQAIKDKDSGHKPNSAEALELLRGHSGILRDPLLNDLRSCFLCHRAGDLREDGPGRLLCYGVDEWIHLNCSLWCYEVYEAICGSLNNERSCYIRARRTPCSYCGTLGAGLPCYNPRCSAVYHVPCAQEIGCMFFTDRGMYCPQHQPLEHHPMKLPSLAVYRRVYLAREENEQVAQVIHEEEPLHIVRIGGLCLHSVGQLLPHQLESGRFHTQRYIYPVGFRTVRIYWSMRRVFCRGRYLCEVQECSGAPNFVITAIDKGLANETVIGATCDAAWHQILGRIASLRTSHRLIKLFPQYNKGEDLFGLSEPHIVRAIESLPGVDQLRDYVFKFGRLQLIAEMPLAINPSGCSRSEPKMRTYIKRTRRNGDFIPSTSTRFTSSGSSGLMHRNSIAHLSLYNKLLPGSVDTSSRQSLVGRSQQYRRLKLEINNNIILGRSRIQGLGLFAARDLDQHTMVIEYIGELIRVQLANKREKVYEAHNRGIYMFRLDEDTVIDATVSGGLARYINHSCEPNCVAEYVNFGEGGHIVIITTCKIHKGEELTYDYNFDLEDCTSKIPCHCGSFNCRKWMN
ncbi:unnamed protein product [Protopolystoma xenopodis]|uniref:Histone-lysine N-methyltransferase n=1 Tax=Protopolystoma xenopodis TaxID=117903 RepID=A0A448WEJ8_9PLAT|nr:unnamed protein product [Protopolystoma xenopodis]